MIIEIQEREFLIDVLRVSANHSEVALGRNQDILTGLGYNSRSITKFNFFNAKTPYPHVTLCFKEFVFLIAIYQHCE